MRYEEVIAELFRRRANFSRCALEAVRRFSEACGRPEKAFPAIHVAGTNGKGSVSLKIAKALEYSGYKVGLFTSPHLFSYCERIAVNGRLISEERVRQGLLELFSVVEREACFFELTTLLAFLYFREEKVDVAVIEAGIGGLYDTTNIVLPCLSVITSIAKDHAHVLGHTLEEIAVQKAGIIKKGVPVVVGPHADLPIMQVRAKEMGSPLHRVAPVPGFYDFENQAIARKALECLHIKEEAIIHGLQVRPPCRFEQIGNVVFDVAHNPDGIRRLIEAVEIHFPQTPWAAAVGLSCDKEVAEILSLLAEKAEHIFLLKGATSRAVEPGKMGESLKKMGYKAFTAGRPLSEILAQDRLVVVCGTFYLMHEARKWVEIPRDEPLLCIR